MTDQDRELIELAAKAAGIEIKGFTEPPFGGDPVIHFDAQTITAWNPLADDGDTARLEAICGIDVEWHSVGVVARKMRPNRLHDIVVRITFEEHGGDKNKARRYASTRAAAAMAGDTPATNGTGEAGK